MRAFLLLFILGIYPTVAASFFGKYQGYVCDSFEQTTSCSLGCREYDVKFEFKVKRSTNEVVIVGYKDGSVIDIKRRVDCAIVDARTWSCPTDNGNGIERMANGVYRSLFFFQLDGLRLLHSCAKR